MQEPESFGAMLFVLFLLGVFVLIMVARDTKWFSRWRKNSPDIEKVRDEFAELMSDRLGIAMRAAELDKIIIDKWEAWPLEYRPALYQVLRHTQLLEETMYEEAATKGVYPRRVVTHGPLIPPPPAMPRLPPEPEVGVTEPPPENVVPINEGKREWINGQLLRTG